MQLKDQFIGNVRVLDFNGIRSMEINQDAYQVLDLLEQKFSVAKCIDILAERYQTDKKDIEPSVIEIIRSAAEIGLVEYAETRPDTRETVIPTCLKLDYQYPLDRAFIELLAKCNLSCKHCYGSFGPTLSEALSKDTVFSLLDQLKELQCPDVRFTGGEIFLHPGFLEILDYAQGHNFIINILTNGTLITRGIVDKLKKMGQMIFRVSIEGHTAQIHDTFCGRAGAFEKSIRAVKMLKEAGFRVRINHNMHKNSYKFAGAMSDLANELKVPISFGHVHRDGNCLEHVDEIYIEPQTYHNTFKKLSKRSPKGGGNEVSTVGKNTKNHIERCSAGKSRFAVLSNGNVSPCITFPRIDRFVMGNIYKSSIRDIVFNYNREKSIASFNSLEIEECKDCKHVAECKGGCIAVAYAETGEIHKPDPFFCARRRAEAASTGGRL
jgi:radical SAM protein with 4Fe4S-binding SPASM domain